MRKAFQIPLLEVALIAVFAGTVFPASLARASTPVQDGGGLTVMLSHTSAGDALAGPGGMTLYILAADHEGTSTCTTGSCASNWPALKVDESQIHPGAGVSGTFGSTTWQDGTKQVTYNGRPLYYYSRDTIVGDALGQGRKGIWFIASADAEPPHDIPGPAKHASATSGGAY